MLHRKSCTAGKSEGYQLSGEPNGREPFGENDIDGGWTEGVGGNTHLYS